MRIDTEKLARVKEYLEKINRTPLHEIEFYEGGDQIDIPERLIEDWKFLGLNNTEFIFTGFYKQDRAAQDISKAKVSVRRTDAFIDDCCDEWPNCCCVAS